MDMIRHDYGDKKCPLGAIPVAEGLENLLPIIIL
jgi:hypothetical protein